MYKKLIINYRDITDTSGIFRVYLMGRGDITKIFDAKRFRILLYFIKVMNEKKT